MKLIRTINRVFHTLKTLILRAFYRFYDDYLIFFKTPKKSLRTMTSSNSRSAEVFHSSVEKVDILSMGFR